MVVNQGARIGVAAFALGLSVLGPQAVAVADSGGPDSSTTSATSAESRESSPVRSTRAASPRKSAAERPAARQRSAPGPAAAAKTRNARPGGTESPRPATVAVPDNLPPVRDADVAPASPSASTSGRVTAVARPAAVAPRPALSARALLTGAPEPEAGEAIDGPSSQRGIESPERPSLDQRLDALVYGVLDGVSNLLEQLPARPFTELLQGAFLLVRRTFFDQAPTVDPQQLTGQLIGPITGTVGAVDPENDPIIYSIVQAPQDGILTIDANGNFLYTPGAEFSGQDAFIVAASDKAPKSGTMNSKAAAPNLLGGNWIDPRRPANTQAVVTVTQGTGPRIEFEFSYIQTRYGLFVQRWSQEAKTGLQWAAYTLVNDIIPAKDVTLTFKVIAESDRRSDTLASASSELTDSAAGFFPTVVQSRVLTGSPSVITRGKTVPDGEVTVNFASEWGYGGVVGAEQYDYASVMMHEFTHAFGFTSYLRTPGCNVYECDARDKPTTTPRNTWPIFAGFITDSEGNPVFDGTEWQTAFDPNLLGDDGGLYFNGPKARAAFNGAVPLFTPNPWEQGSSMAHMNDVYFDGVKAPIQLMNAKDNPGVPAPKFLSAYEIGILQDLGYKFATTPASSPD